MSPVPLVSTGVTGPRERWVTLVKTELEVCQDKRVLVVCPDLLENPEGLVWTEQKETPVVMEIPVDLELQVAREVLADLEVPENPVVEVNLAVMELRESLVEAAWTVDLELPV